MRKKLAWLKQPHANEAMNALKKMREAGAHSQEIIKEWERIGFSHPTGKKWEQHDVSYLALRVMRLAPLIDMSAKKQMKLPIEKPRTLFASVNPVAPSQVESDIDLIAEVATHPNLTDELKKTLIKKIAKTLTGGEA